jgi:hypothetical protein
MMMKKLLFIFLIGIGSISAQNDTTFNWLIGKWEAVTTQGVFFEQWKAGSQQLEGSGGEIVKGDTVFKETLFLLKKKGHWNYVAEVGKQEPVEFPLIQVLEHRYKFENKKHDFPQRIIYEYIDRDHFNARVEGKINGKMGQDVYNMKRVK